MNKGLFGAYGLVALLLMFSMLASCTPAKFPFRSVRLCVYDKQGVAQFKAEMEEIAEARDMSYVDASGSYVQSAFSRKIKHGQKPVFISVRNKQADMGLMATDMGPGTYRISIGFIYTRPALSTDAHQFADYVVHKLKQHWHVYAAPVGPTPLSAKPCKKSATLQKRDAEPEKRGEG